MLLTGRIEKEKSCKEAQVALETALTFTALIFLLMGMFRIGVWYHNELAERQQAFDSTREAAAKKSSPGNVGVWPVYSRRSLTEDWVLTGENFPR